MIKINKDIGFWNCDNTTLLDDLAYASYCQSMYSLYNPFGVKQREYLVRQSHFMGSKKIMWYFYDEAKIILRKYKMDKIINENT